MMARKIYPYSLDTKDAKIAGVCSTLGAKFGIDPTTRRRERAVGRVVGQLEALQFEPAIPRLEPGDGSGDQSADDARADHAYRDRIHHFASSGLRSFSISRASSSFWVLRW